MLDSIPVEVEVGSEHYIIVLKEKIIPTGEIMTDNITLQSDEYEGGIFPLKFTLSCVSTGGPATNVTWSRVSTIVRNDTVTVLEDPVTAKYKHTLTVTGWRGGVYNCTVSNNKPSTDSSVFKVAGNKTGKVIIVLYWL